MEKYVKLGIVITGVLAWVLMAAFFQTIIGWINPDWDRMLIGQQFTLSDLLGLITGLGVFMAVGTFTAPSTAVLRGRERVRQTCAGQEASNPVPTARG